MRNTDYVIGLVVNTGRDTKVMQGATDPPLKHSSLDRGINYLMVGIISLQLFLCAIATVLRLVYDQEMETHWYAHESIGELSDSISLEVLVLGILRWFVTLAAFVSVSLYVSVDSNKARLPNREAQLSLLCVQAPRALRSLLPSCLALTTRRHS